MKYKLLDTIVLNRDLPAQNLREGDMGSIVHIYEPNRVEVEFVITSGQTSALVTLTTEDVLNIHDRIQPDGELDDLVAEIKHRRTES